MRLLIYHFYILTANLFPIFKYVEGLQFEILRLRQEDEAKEQQTTTPQLPFAEILDGELKPKSSEFDHVGGVLMHRIMRRSPDKSFKSSLFS